MLEKIEVFTMAKYARKDCNRQFCLPYESQTSEECELLRLATFFLDVHYLIVLLS